MAISVNIHIFPCFKLQIPITYAESSFDYILIKKTRNVVSYDIYHLMTVFTVLVPPRKLIRNMREHLLGHIIK